jgi:formate hydrogenlyase transcriptional activator
MGMLIRMQPQDPDADVRARASEMLWAVLEGTALAPGGAFFPALVHHLAVALAVEYVFVAECTDETRTRVRTLAFWSRDTLTGNIEFAVDGTPCEAVIDGQVCWHTCDLQTRFPRDVGLVELDAHSYLGVPLIGTSGDILGHLAVLDIKPMVHDDARALLLRTFASRAVIELERLRTTNQIAALNQKLTLAAERSRSLLAINNAVVLNLTHDALFQAITEALRPVVPFDRSTIFLHDNERQVLRLVAAESAITSELFKPGLELPLEGSHAGWAFRHQRVFFRPDLEKERQYEGEHVLLREGFRSLVVVPLVVRGTSIGTLNLGSVRPMQYGAAEAELLQEVANQLALAIENMREYEEIDRLKAQLERENVYLQEEITDHHNFKEIVGSSPALLAALRTIDRVAPTDSTVLILEETGTGKELVARAIHRRSPRHRHPLVKVNCGAIPAGLIESELFGHVRGAFTGALDRRVGRFELADGGTLFLDEIGELPPDMQVKLLRVLQEHEFESVGSSRTTKVDVRIIAATNRDLQHEVSVGRFRADLYYRLNVLQVRVPALRERLEDIPELALLFVQRYAKRIGRTISGVSKGSMERLAAYPWPGNVRELENVIERALVLSASRILEIGTDLLPTSVPVAARERAETIRTTASTSQSIGGDGPEPAGALLSSLDDVQRVHIAAALNQTGWVIEGSGGAARILNLHPNTLRSRMKKLGLTRREVK